MNLITRDTDYAIRALLYMAKENKKIITVSEMAKKTKIPYPFLRKILQTLHKNGILCSYKGSKGGFSFRANPEDIFILELIRIFQGRLKINKCFLKKKICPEISTCKLKNILDSIIEDALLKLKYVSIKSLLNY